MAMQPSSPATRERARLAVERASECAESEMKRALLSLRFFETLAWSFEAWSLRSDLADADARGWGHRALIERCREIEALAQREE